MRTKNITKYYKYAAIVLAVVSLVSAGFVLLKLWENSQSKYATIDPENPYVVYDGRVYLLKDNVESFLVIGLDKYEGDATADSYNNDKQADFLMLFVFDNDAKTCSAIQINRDTMAEISVLGVAGDTVDTVTKQIALAHSYGDGDKVSCRNTVEAVSGVLLGMKVNNYISVTMDAVPLYNDLLGGVEVEITDDFSGIDDALIKGEKITLTGEQALTYVRTRYGLEDSTNSTRMERQRQYIHAMYEQTLARMAVDEEFAVNATLQMSEYIVSDRSVTQLQELLNKFSEYEFTGISYMTGESKVGDQFMEFYPAQESVEQIVIKTFYKERD